MRSRYTIKEPEKAHFITSTVVDWLPLFTSEAACDILIHTLAHSRKHKGLKLYAWVIMDSHFHAIVAGSDLAKTIGELRSFSAKSVLELLETDGRDWLLNQLKFRCAKHKPKQKFQVWKEGCHPQAIFDDEMMLQKIDYIHSNPVKRGLVASPEHWRYSSAHKSLAGANPVLKCDPWR